jgi:hypothetical protein
MRRAFSATTRRRRPHQRRLHLHRHRRRHRRELEFDCTSVFFCFVCALIQLSHRSIRHHLFHLQFLFRI